MDNLACIISGLDGKILIISKFSQKINFEFEILCNKYKYKYILVIINTQFHITYTKLYYYIKNTVTF